jgi:hypothetical protein
MKYYITDKATWHSVRNHATSSHFLDLENGQILVKADFADPSKAANFTHPRIVPLPHPYRQTKLHPDVVSVLAHLGVNETHSTMDVSDIVEKIHPLMSLDH